MSTQNILEKKTRASKPIAITNPEGMKRIVKIMKGARGNLSYREFAKKTGISAQMLNRIENFEANLSQKKLESLASHCGYSEAEFIGIYWGDTQKCEAKTCDDAIAYVLKMPLSEQMRLVEAIADQDKEIAKEILLLMARRL